MSMTRQRTKGETKSQNRSWSRSWESWSLELEASRDRKDSHSHYLSDQISLAARLGGALSLTQTKK